jgi:hypothetical protein
LVALRVTALHLTPHRFIKRTASCCRGFSQPPSAHGCKCCALLHFVTAARGASASSAASAFRISASGAAKKEDAMQLWTFNELMLMTREELCDLNARLERALTQHEAGSMARADLLASLKTVRKVMVLRGLHF